MPDSDAQPTFLESPDQSQFEVWVAGQLVGVVEYRRRADRIAFIQTEIDEAHEGHGLGWRLISDALEKAREENLEVMPF
jgi:predicted GNAT family acetyltransferase